MTLIPLYELPVDSSESDYIFYDCDKCLLELKENDAISGLDNYILNNTTWTYKDKVFYSDVGGIKIEYRDDEIIKSAIKVLSISDEMTAREDLTEKFFNFVAMLAISLRSDNKENPYHFTFTLDEELNVLRILLGQNRDNELICGECGFKLEYLKELLQKITDEITLYRVLKGLTKMLKDELERHVDD